jgi:putative redox protein
MSINLQKNEIGTYRQTIRIYQHTLFADVATSFGGDDSAPEPHDFYDASLAACKAITLLMFAKRKQIPLTSVDVEIARDNSRETKGVYVLDVCLTFNGDLTPEHRTQLSDVADKCPIHKLMTSTHIEVNSTYH